MKVSIPKNEVIYLNPKERPAEDFVYKEAVRFLVERFGLRKEEGFLKTRFFGSRSLTSSLPDLQPFYLIAPNTPRSILEQNVLSYLGLSPHLVTLLIRSGEERCTADEAKLHAFETHGVKELLGEKPTQLLVGASFHISKGAGNYQNFLTVFVAEGYSRFLIDGELRRFKKVEEIKKRKGENEIVVIVDSLSDVDDNQRLKESLEQAGKLGGDVVLVSLNEKGEVEKELVASEDLICPTCKRTYKKHSFDSVQNVLSEEKRLEDYPLLFFRELEAQRLFTTPIRELPLREEVGFRRLFEGVESLNLGHVTFAKKLSELSSAELIKLKVLKFFLLRFRDFLIIVDRPSSVLGEVGLEEFTSFIKEKLQGNTRLVLDRESAKSEEDVFVESKKSENNITAIVGKSGAERSKYLRTLLDKQNTSHVIDGFSILNKLSSKRWPSSADTFFCVSGLEKEFAKVFSHAKGSNVPEKSFILSAPGGRCSRCKGLGVLRTRGAPLGFVECSLCEGERFSLEALSVKVSGVSIGEVLKLTVAEALVAFSFSRKLFDMLTLFKILGFGSMRLETFLSELSVSEVSRVVLGRQLLFTNKKNVLFAVDNLFGGETVDVAQSALSFLKSKLEEQKSKLIFTSHERAFCQFAGEVEILS